MRHIGEINETLELIASDIGVIYVSKKDISCDYDKQFCFGMTPEGHKIIYDYGHFSMDGARYMGNRMHQIDWLAPLYEALNQQ